MAVNNPYLKLFVDSLEKYQKLNDSEFGRLVRAALRYKATGAEPDDLGREALLWDGMKLDIDRDNQAYWEIVKSRSEAGKKGACARWQTDSKNGKCHLPYGKNGQDKDKEEDKDKKKESAKADEKKAGRPRRTGFVPPTLEEVQAYCRERGNDVDPQCFVDYFSASGWVDSKGNPVLNWKQKVITWEKHSQPRKKPADWEQDRLLREDI